MTSAEWESERCKSLHARAVLSLVMFSKGLNPACVVEEQKEKEQKKSSDVEVSFYFTGIKYMHNSQFYVHTHETQGEARKSKHR